MSKTKLPKICNEPGQSKQTADHNEQKMPKARLNEVGPNVGDFNSC